ncbi:MAG: polyamine ABC transporter ATP-binding protein [Chloroflexi bacterium]|nr:MAG: polyamine ABC transporter ATP-binding protein [Chloroflexota bacterium]PIE80489.1 MAG: polyamine ABC transporter ATP-binding protein [Chloroflexota bacterium]
MYLNLDNVTKVFPGRGGEGEVTAVDHISVNIAKGKLITLLGPSGCGKTTTLRMIAGFEFPTSGNILLDGKEINNLPPHKRDMSMVFQSYAIFPHLNVFENVAYGLKVARLNKNEITDRVKKTLALVELSGYENRAPNQLSGGQQQRVALARALIMEPKVLLMDEPLSNLDAKLREQMRNEIRRIQQLIDITSVYVTHDQVEAMTISDRIIVMNKGRIEQNGTPTEIYRHPQSRFVADFIGRANFINGVVRAVEKGKLTVELLGRTLTIDAAKDAYTVGTEVTVVVRPEMMVLNPDKSAHVEGIVRRASYLGDVVEYDVEVGTQLLSMVETDPRHLIIHPVGQIVQIGFLEDCLYVLPLAS